MVGEELSEFEKQRLANIAERDALLKKLSLDAQSAGLFPPKMPKDVSADQSKPKKRPAPKSVKKEESPLPRRTSSRLKGIAADSEVAKRKADDEYDRRQEQERAKRARKSDSFSLNDIFVSGQKLPGDALIGVDVITKGVAVPYERTFGDEDVKSTTDKDLRALRKEMNGLNLWEAWEPNRIKLTPERIYSMTFHPSEAKPLIFAGDKMGHLGILDASQEKAKSAVKHEDDDDDDDDPDPVLVTLKPHTRTISSMTVHPSKPTHLYTASYDSSIREMDLEKTSSVEKYAPESTSEDVPISGIDMAAEDPNTIYWTTLDGAFGRYDMRSKRQSSIATWQLSEKKIGGFSLNQTYPHYFATASLDRTMRLWDLRKLSHTNPTPIGEHQSRLSVSHAAFNSTGQIATSSYDDTVKLYDFSARGIASWKPGHTLEDSQMKPDIVVRHNCQTGRWVTILRPQWQLNPQSLIQRFCIGNMNRFVDIYSSSGDQLAQLGGDGITAVPAVAVFHRSKNWVAGGTASGKICLWM
ncbi:WD40-repeat-containing domain protein [Aspergillus cavernicola]|uniref:DNA damage-binding protein CMR1 n=1 Tax=Aspergillus cavernicola TaxID=176166 RepID=A0ABR4IML9_9EURO